MVEFHASDLAVRVRFPLPAPKYIFINIKVFGANYMFYSKYSDFSPEQIISKDYKKLSDHLLSIVKDAEVIEKMKRYII